MSEVSIGGVHLPRARGTRMARKIARDAIYGLLNRLEAGYLTVHEGTATRSFGRPDDPLRAEVQVHDPAVFGLLLTGGSIAAGEAYIRGYWSSPDPVAVTRLFSANLDVLQGMDDSQSLFVRLGLNIAHWFNRNTREGSRDNISAHYDLGNDFFSLFLDRSMMYSSALFVRPGMTLEAASEAKLDELCRQLELTPSDHLLEIGTGWGGMALFAAQNYGCRVTTTTISAEQYEYARERVRAAGLEERITVLCEDYRNLEGQYDKLVSVEMIEAVGHEYYRDYFATCDRLLKANGKMVIQAITVADQRYTLARDSVDYIKRYIFPGGCLPSVAVIADNLARHTSMQMVHLRDITEDYAITLDHWRRRFLEALPSVRAQGFSEEFIRMWEYYLCYCEGGFRERIISTVQLAFAKPDYRFR